MTAATIHSACPVAARIDGSRIVPAYPPALPDRGLALGGWVKRPTGDGRVHLYDAAGGPCGVFANERLADACVAALSR